MKGRNQILKKRSKYKKNKKNFHLIYPIMFLFGQILPTKVLSHENDL